MVHYGALYLIVTSPVTHLGKAQPKYANISWNLIHSPITRRHSRISAQTILPGKNDLAEIHPKRRYWSECHTRGRHEFFSFFFYVPVPCVKQALAIMYLHKFFFCQFEYLTRTRGIRCPVFLFYLSATNEYFGDLKGPLSGQGSLQLCIAARILT